jgi:hypothetical protein
VFESDVALLIITTPDPPFPPSPIGDIVPRDPSPELAGSFGEGFPLD